MSSRRPRAACHPIWWCRRNRYCCRSATWCRCLPWSGPRHRRSRPKRWCWYCPGQRPGSGGGDDDRACSGQRGGGLARIQPQRSGNIQLGAVFHGLPADTVRVRPLLTLISPRSVPIPDHVVSRLKVSVPTLAKVPEKFPPTIVIDLAAPTVPAPWRLRRNWAAEFAKSRTAPASTFNVAVVSKIRKKVPSGITVPPPIVMVGRSLSLVAKFICPEARAYRVPVSCGRAKLEGRYEGQIMLIGKSHSAVGGNDV